MENVKEEPKDNDGTFFNWYERNDMERLFKMTLESFAQSKSQPLEERIKELEEEREAKSGYWVAKIITDVNEAHNKAIQQCIDSIQFKTDAGKEYEYIVKSTLKKLFI